MDEPQGIVAPNFDVKPSAPTPGAHPVPWLAVSVTYLGGQPSDDVSATRLPSPPRLPSVSSSSYSWRRCPSAKSTRQSNSSSTRINRIPPTPEWWTPRVRQSYDTPSPPQLAPSCSHSLQAEPQHAYPPNTFSCVTRCPLYTMRPIHRACAPVECAAPKPCVRWPCFFCTIFTIDRTLTHTTHTQTHISTTHTHTHTHASPRTDKELYEKIRKHPELIDIYTPTHSRIATTE